MHKLSNIDALLKTATCSTCGPVSIRTKGCYKSGKTAWRCASASNPHNIDPTQLGYKFTYIEAKSKILDHYGRECSWCGENDDMVLTIDHVENDGNKHRKQASGPMRVLLQILKAIKFGQAHKFQVLCANCNLAKVKNDGVLPEHRKNLWRVRQTLNT